MIMCLYYGSLSQHNTRLRLGVLPDETIQKYRLFQTSVHHN